MDKETNKAIKLSKSRTKRIVKVAIEKILAIYKRTPIILYANFSAKSHSPGGSVWYIHSTKRKKKSTKNNLPRNSNLFKERDNVFPRQIKTEWIHHH